MNRLVSMLALGLVVSCAPAEDPFTDPDGPSHPGPGTALWGSSDISCQKSSDCGPGEACSGDICQPTACSESPPSSLPPFGPSLLVSADMELVAVGSGSIRQYDKQGSASSFNFVDSEGAGSAIDVAGGAFDESGTGGVAYVTGASKVHYLPHEGAATERSTPFPSSRIAVADVDGDHVDDVVVAGTRALAWCPGTAGDCETIVTPHDLIDVDVADFSGTGKSQILGLAGDVIAVWDTRSGLLQTITLPEPGLAMAVGDLDRDFVDEVVIIEDGGWVGFADDKVRVYEYVNGVLELSATTEVDTAFVDVAIGDLERDEVAEIVVLDDDSRAYVFTYTDRINTVFSAQLPNDVTRLGMSDVDGNSLRAKRVGEPELVAGTPKPIVAVTFPPYHRSFSDGEPSITMGRFDNVSNGTYESVEMKVAAMIGYSAGVNGVFKQSYGAKIGVEVSRGRALTDSITIGDRVSLTAQPELYGDSYGAVLLGSTCFRSYRYRVENSSDPEANGEDIVVVVPVEGQSTLWSTARYNSLAEARGDLPQIDIAAKLGNLSSYPQTPQRLSGEVVSEDDLVFPQTPTFEVSDSANIAWSLSAAETSANSGNMRLLGSAKVFVNLAGFSFGAELRGERNSGYYIDASSSLSLRGSTPPIPDDPSTPEDEYAQHAFSFSPVMYVEHYQNAAGEQESFYAISYTASAP